MDDRLTVIQFEKVIHVILDCQVTPRKYTSDKLYQI
jgi:hypothetical protein